MSVAAMKQEPVAWAHPQALGQDFIAYSVRVSSEQIPLYTAPKPEWVGLTDEEIDVIQELPLSQNDYLTHYAYAIAAKLKEKNRG